MFEFDVFCIMIAAVLAAFSIERFRKISLLLLINFIFFYLAAGVIDIHQSELPIYTQHATYTIFSLLTIVALLAFGANIPLIVLMFVYSLYNYGIVLEYQPELGSFGLHNNFIPFARAQMCVELIIMFLMSKWSRYVWHRVNPSRNYNYFIDRFFRSRVRLGSKGFV